MNFSANQIILRQLIDYWIVVRMLLESHMHVTKITHGIWLVIPTQKMEKLRKL